MKIKKFIQILTGAAVTASLFLSVVGTADAQTPVIPTPEITGTAPATAATPTSTQVVTGTQSLCLPYLDGSPSLNCLMAGPAQFLASLAAQGIVFPPEPMAIAHPPADLANIPFSYAKVVPDAVPMYASFEDAEANNIKEMLPAGKVKYVALSQKETTPEGTSFYQIANDEWINADTVSKVAAAHFQGYLINQFPDVPFGWVLQSEVPSYVAPGYASAKTGKIYNRLDMVRCYDSKVVDNMEWVMVGPNEWIEHRFIARVLNNPTPPAGVTNGRWIEVNLYEQVMAVYDNSKMIFATLVGSGMAPFYTQPGTFKIYRKVEHEYMTGAFEADRSDFYYLEQVPFILYYDQSRALHGAYWNNYLGNPGSHGCVNLSVADAHWLYNWANVGDTVYVWDPSGKTPSESPLYSQGAF